MPLPPPPPLFAAGTTTAAALRRVAVPAYLAVAGNSAYFAYYALVAGGGEVSVLAPLVGLYSIVPISWGLAFRGESRAWPKLAGIALSLVAVLVLGFAGAAAPGRPTTPASIALTATWFVIVFAVWGSNDAIAAAVKLDPLTTALSSLVGQLACCSLFGFAAYVQATTQAAAAGGAGGGGGGGGGGAGVAPVGMALKP